LEKGAIEELPRSAGVDDKTLFPSEKGVHRVHTDLVDEAFCEKIFFGLLCRHKEAEAILPCTFFCCGLSATAFTDRDL
jgi:hypothetical protein